MIDVTGYVLSQKHLDKAANKNPEGLRRLAKYLKIDDKEVAIGHIRDQVSFRIISLKLKDSMNEII